MTYKELLLKSKEVLDSIKAPFVAAKAHKDLEVRMLDLQQQIAEDDLKIQEEKSKNPVNWATIGDSIDKKQLNERRLKQYQDLEFELFPKE